MSPDDEFLRPARASRPLTVSPHPDSPPDGQVLTWERRAVPWFLAAGCIVLGVALLGAGIGSGLGTITVHTNNSALSPSEGMLVFGGLGLLLSLAGLLPLLWRSRLTIDPAAGGYRLQRGFAPFAASVSGPLTDMDRVRVLRTGSPDPDAAASDAAWRVSVIWKDGRRQSFEVLIADTVEAGLGEGCRVSAAACVPLEDRSTEMTAYERKKGRARDC